MFKYLLQQQQLYGRHCGLVCKKQTLLLRPDSEVAFGKISNKFDKQVDSSDKSTIPLGQGARGGRSNLLDPRLFLPRLKSHFKLFE